MYNLQELLMAGLEHSPSAVCIFDEQRTVIFCNQPFADIYASTPEEAIGKNADELLYKAWRSKRGVRIETNDFDAWIQKLRVVHEKHASFEFETDLYDGRWFKMTRMRLDNNCHVLFGADITQLKQCQAELIEQNEKITHLTLTDQLTGIYNRRAFEDLGKKEFYRSRRFGQSFSALMVDIDYFKSINDTYGHQAGDEVLAEFAKVWQQSLRQSDVFARIGGEEFFTILPNTSEQDAENLANRLKQSIATLAFTPSCLDRSISFTVSIGVSSLHPDDKEFGDVVSRSDTALYHSKSTGRNKVTVAE